jgi:Ca2+/Na+ antiporter
MASTEPHQLPRHQLPFLPGYVFKYADDKVRLLTTILTVSCSILTMEIRKNQTFENLTSLTIAIMLLCLTIPSLALVTTKLECWVWTAFLYTLYYRW